MIRDGRSPTEPWLPSDRALALALTLFEQHRGPCGHDMAQAYGGHGSWGVETIVCAACAVEEQYRAENENPEPGLKVFAVEESEAVNAPGEVAPVFS